MIERQTIDTLKSFYHLMTQTRSVRSGVVTRLLSSSVVEREQIDALKNALASLEQCLKGEYKATFKIDRSENIDVDLTYEVKELKKV